MKLYEIEVSRLKAKIKKAIKQLKITCTSYGFETLDLSESVWIHKIENNELVFSKSVLLDASKHQDSLQIYVLNQQLEKINEIKTFVKSSVYELVV